VVTVPFYLNFGLPGPFSYGRRIGGRRRPSTPSKTPEEQRAQMEAAFQHADEARARLDADPKLRRNYRITLGALLVIWVVLALTWPWVALVIAVFVGLGLAGNRFYRWRYNWQGGSE
jgi:Flp pilus assembly protein TadB